MAENIAAAVRALAEEEIGDSPYEQEWVEAAERVGIAAAQIAFRAGFRAGFDVSREGFNGGCENDHCAPSPFKYSDDPLQAAEDAAWLEALTGTGLSSTSRPLR